MICDRSPTYRDLKTWSLVQVLWWTHVCLVLSSGTAWRAMRRTTRRSAAPLTSWWGLTVSPVPVGLHRSSELNCLCLVSSQNFYKSEINKEEMYIRYIHKLCDMHLQAENYTGTVHTHTQSHTITHTHSHTHPSTLSDRCASGPTEAAFTLLLYWELLHWDERPLKDFLHYPAQTEWHRKEALCRKVIHYFNKGKVRARSRACPRVPPAGHWEETTLSLVPDGHREKVWTTTVRDTVLPTVNYS